MSSTDDERPSLYRDPFAHIDLPPKPDPRTGEPRPPHAIREWEGETKERDHDKRHAPDPPEGQGPVLEWFKLSQRSAITNSVVVVILIAVGGTIATAGVGWMSLWWVWIIILALGALVYWTARGKPCAAGADWLSNGNRWVRVYELSSVEVKMQSYNRELRLKDREGRHLNITLRTIQYHQELWDLVYNGILHSVVAGHAETNALARQALHLPG